MSQQLLLSQKNRLMASTDGRICDKCKRNVSAYKLGRKSEYRLCPECMNKWVEFHNLNPYKKRMDDAHHKPIFHGVWLEIFFAFLGRTIREKVQFT